jgi:uncharacterized protein YcfJ
MKTLSLLILSLTAGAALAQPINNYLPDADTRVPEGASGPGIVHTQRVLGRVISIGNPVMKSVATGRTCYPTQQPQYQQQQQNDSSLNEGTILGALAGGIIGNQVGGGDGKKAAVAIGAVTGAMVGNNMHQQQQQPSRNQYQPNQQQCETTFEQRIVGYSFVVEYNHLQMQGFMNRQPQIGESVQVIVRSTYYPGS